MILDNNSELSELVKRWLIGRFQEANLIYPDQYKVIFLDELNVTWNTTTGIVTIPDELVTFILLDSNYD